MSGVPVIVGYALRESLRRRVFVVVLLLTALFLGLYGWGTDEAFKDVDAFIGYEAEGPVDTRELAGATLFGLSMFATLFLGTVLAIFLTLGVVRGDAARGLLQPLVVRPIGRSTLLFARFLSAAAVCTVYVLLVYFGAMLITRATGGWWPDRLLSPGLELVCDRVVILNRGKAVAAGRPSDLARTGGVEVETESGIRLFESAKRDDAPRIVAELVATGEKVYGVRVIRSTLEEVYLEAVEGDEP